MPPPISPPHALFRLLVLCCFFFSGATGLLYQVVWIRLLGFTLGNTHHSLTLVVAVFMGGLALGSWLGGRVADRSSDPLRLYGVLILAVGVVCLAVPFVIRAFEPLFAAIYRTRDGFPDAPLLLVAKLLVSSAILLVPTTLMGATLPVLSKHFTRSLDRVGWDFGRLYAVNTFGAVTGAFFTGVIGIRVLGLWGCIVAAVVIDIVIAAVVFRLAARRRPAPAASAPRAPAHARAETSPVAPSPASRRDLRLPVLAFALSGFANMILQVAWTKTLVGTIGNSTYAFSIIVTLFILGIGLGGAAMARYADAIRNVPLCLGVLLLVTGAVVLATIPILGVFPVLGAMAFAGADPSFSSMLWRQVGLVAVVLLPATTLMGMVFPLVGRWVTRTLDTVGRSIGNAYFANTLGSILGTLTAGFVLIPLLGRVHASLYIASGLSIAAGLVLVLRFAGARRTRFGGVAVVIALLGLAWIFRPHGVLGSENRAWHPAIQSLGIYKRVYADIVTRDARGFDTVAQRLIESGSILYFREGVHASVAIAEQPGTGVFALRISGKPEGSARRDGRKTNDMPHQLGAAHLPMLIHPGPEAVLTLGLGSGVTLGGLTLYAADPAAADVAASARVHTVESIDSLEISEEVLEAVELHFAAVNHDATRHPVVRHVLGDGRNHLLYTDRRYDVITSVPSNPWIAGIGNLFTVEFFEIVRDRLRPGGVFCQWIHSLDIRTEDFRMVLRTVQEVFPEHVELWDLGYDCLLIASDGAARLDSERVERALADRRIAEDLALLGVDAPARLARFLKWTSKDVRAFAGTGPLNRDLAPYLEFNAPLGLHGHQLDTFDAILARPPSPERQAWGRTTPALQESVIADRNSFEAFQRFFAIHQRAIELAADAKLALFKEILLAGDPWPANLAGDLSSAPETAYQLARVALSDGRISLAEAILVHRLERHAANPHVIHLLGFTLAQRGDLRGAIDRFDQALRLARSPKDVAMFRNDKGFALESLGEREAARAEYAAALAADSASEAARRNLDRLGP